MASSPLFFLFLKLAFLFSVIYPSPIFCCDPNDLQALKSFVSDLENGSIISNWSTKSSCCNWTGVFCNNLDKVTSLHLSNLGLVGAISSSLSNLGQHQSLDLSSNSLTGSVPIQLANLINLQSLNLSYNALLGRVATFSSMQSLKSLDLSLNFFNGSFSDFGVNLPRLSFLNVSNNSMAGLIGPDICIGSKHVKVIDISTNHFSGSVGGEFFANCSWSLQELDLGFNSLSGNLPDELFDLVSLERLSLECNDISGKLSEDISKFVRMKSLILSGNRLSGHVPNVFGNLTMLEQLIAPSNAFSGEIRCSTLKELDLRNNSLSGQFDLDFSGLCNLISLDLASNYLKGPLPTSLSSCRELKTLSLAKNALSGQIPAELGNLESLSFFSLSNNSFHNISRALAVLGNFYSTSASRWQKRSWDLMGITNANNKRAPIVEIKTRKQTKNRDT